MAKIYFLFIIFGMRTLSLGEVLVPLMGKLAALSEHTWSFLQALKSTARLTRPASASLRATSETVSRLSSRTGKKPETTREWSQIFLLTSARRNCRIREWPGLEGTLKFI